MADSNIVRLGHTPTGCQVIVPTRVRLGSNVAFPDTLAAWIYEATLTLAAGEPAEST